MADLKENVHTFYFRLNVSLKSSNKSNETIFRCAFIPRLGFEGFQLLLCWHVNNAIITGWALQRHLIGHVWLGEPGVPSQRLSSVVWVTASAQWQALKRSFLLYYLPAHSFVLSAFLSLHWRERRSEVSVLMSQFFSYTRLLDGN